MDNKNVIYYNQMDNKNAIYLIKKKKKSNEMEDMSDIYEIESYNNIGASGSD